MHRSLFQFYLYPVVIIIPYIFVYNPGLLLINTTPLDVVLLSITAILGAFSLALAGSGFWMTNLNFVERLVLFGGAIGLMALLIALLVLIFWAPVEWYIALVIASIFGIAVGFLISNSVAIAPAISFLYLSLSLAILFDVSSFGSQP